MQFLILLTNYMRKLNSQFSPFSYLFQVVEDSTVYKKGRKKMKKKKRRMKKHKGKRKGWRNGRENGQTNKEQQKNNKNIKVAIPFIGPPSNFFCPFRGSFLVQVQFGKCYGQVLNLEYFCIEIPLILFKHLDWGLMTVMVWVHLSVT